MTDFKALMEGSASRWDAFWYTVVWLLGTLQTVVLKVCIRQHVWRSFNGTVYTPLTMTDSHLRNAIRYCERAEQTNEPVYWALRQENERRVRLQRS